MARRKVPEPIAVFRVYPDKPSRLFYRVKVFRNVREMHAYVRNRPMPSRPGRFCKGIVTSWTVLRVGASGCRATPDLGEIVLCRGWLGSELLSHESGHAALGWARRVRINATENDPDSENVSDSEERFCYGLGKIMRGLVNGLHAKGLLP